MGFAHCLTLSKFSKSKLNIIQTILLKHILLDATSCKIGKTDVLSCSRPEAVTFFAFMLLLGSVYYFNKREFCVEKSLRMFKEIEFCIAQNQVNQCIPKI